MKTPAYILGPDFISVVLSGKPHTVYSNDIRFSKVKEIIKNKEWDKLDLVTDIPKAIALYTFGKVQVFGGEILYNGKAAHNAVTSRILEFINEGFPFEPLVKFLDKLMLNPSERSIEQLYKYLELYKLPITEDGDFIAQKKVTEDFLDMHTKKISNAVGQIVEMSRDLVNDDPNCGCHAGLHVGSEDFVRTFGSGTTILCKINPRDVVSIPFDSSYAKMRVCRYEVIGTVGGGIAVDGQEQEEKPTKFTSNYAKSSDVTRQNEKVMDAPKANTTVKSIGANKAYELHKTTAQAVYSPTYGKAVLFTDNQSRKFFRQYKDWQVITAEELVALEKPAKVASNKIGQNRAYELYKAGKKVTNVLTGIVAFEDNKTRSFFRSYSNWETV